VDGVPARSLARECDYSQDSSRISASDRNSVAFSGTRIAWSRGNKFCIPSTVSSRVYRGGGERCSISVFALFSPRV